MLIERPLHTDLRTMLMANEAFEYAHLIKFERPSRPDSKTGRVSTAGVRYTYLTDASRDIGFDDGSKDLNSNSNGSQSYLANKILKVSEVSEATEAKASNFTVVMDGNGLGAELGSQSMTITNPSTGVYDIAINDLTTDSVYEGFREGDKITLYGDRIGSFNIDSFRSGNIIRVKKIDDNLVIGTVNIGFRLDSEEIKSILLNKNIPEYASFINREVFIYKIYQQNGTTVGAPFLLFKGNISNVSFEDSDSGIIVSWGLTSQWGDFSQIKGRLTSDDFHRALDQNGNPQPDSALKVEYAYDKGFIHAETSVNILAQYLVSVEKQDIKTKKGFFGIGAKVKVKKYYVNETRHTQLDFQLVAKAIPLHYGVKITSGTPVFADTLKNDSSTVYVIYALGEGQISSIYDIYIEDKSIICNDKADFDVRSQQTATNTVDLVCRGRADRGDVLGGTISTDNNPASTIDYYADRSDYIGYNSYGYGGYGRNVIQYQNYKPYITPPEATYSGGGRGIIAGESISLTSPISMTLDFFGGSESQEAASQLVEISKASNFKIQTDYWTGKETAEYWGPNHRLVDTAYVVAKYKIKEGETTIPDLKFIIKAKIIDCYNYDFSYTHSLKTTSENEANFNLGDTVSLYRSDNDVLINSNVQIIDKWFFIDADGNVDTRFRFSTAPVLGYVNSIPSITKFYMKAGVDTWTMTTFNYIEHSGTITNQIVADITPVNSGGDYTIPLPVDPIWNAGGQPGQPSPVYSVRNSDLLLFGMVTGSYIYTKYNYYSTLNYV